MTNEQQKNINAIIEGYYANGADTQWREVASFVYANALRDPDISLLELKTQFEPLQKIAESTGLVENSKAIGRAITQPFVDGAKALQDGRTLASAAATVIILADDPLVAVNGAWNGVQSAAEAAYRLTQHSTGLLTIEERQRLAAMYDLPHKQRIQALHGVRLNDTAAMVSVGSLPGLFPNAMTKAHIVVHDTGAAVASEVNKLPKYNGAYPVPAIAGANVSTESSFPISPQVLSPQVLTMASKDSGIGGGSGDENANRKKKFNLADYEFPDPNYDHERVWYKHYLKEHAVNLSEQMKSLGLKNEVAQTQKQLGYMQNVQITTNASEYNVALNNSQDLVAKAEKTAYEKAIASGLSPEDAQNQADALTREFSMLQKYVEYERNKSFVDLAKDQNKLELQEKARLDPDSVGYDRVVFPRSTTERELNHHLYLQKFDESVVDLRVKLELLGLKERADVLGDQMRELLTVSLESSKAAHQQRLENFMKIEEEAKGADIKNASTSISARYFHMIQEDIGGELAHLKVEIGHDREYHIRHQLWQRQSGDERRARENTEIAMARGELFGNDNSSATQAPDLEP
ncbi:MAG: hypothetical protein PHO76_10670 [Methylotenera sp.]|nr:hypothetical protein [Methylotenera sp.]MDD4927219.1 hypothetical protein [Methylotenera sp.]